MDRPTLFETLRKEVKTRGYDARSRSSRVWFQGKVAELAGQVNPNRILGDRSVKVRRGPVVGQMFMFIYDPKGKQTLPYYDKFPLVLMVDSAPGGFYGLNLHYLEPQIRAAFLDKLLDLSNSKTLNLNTKLGLTYSVLKQVQRYREFKPCFKHYLSEHIQSRIAQVDGQDWVSAIFLPSEDFAKVSSTKVWADSKKEYLAS